MGDRMGDALTTDPLRNAREHELIPVHYLAGLMEGAIWAERPDEVSYCPRPELVEIWAREIAAPLESYVRAAQRATAPRSRDASPAPADTEELVRLRSLLNTPEIEEFDKAVPLEAAHQVVRWGVAHDGGKNPEDWFWLVGYLAGKALSALKAGDLDKAKHHCISTAAALRNWHAHIRSGATVMRPGMDPARAVQVAEGSTTILDEPEATLDLILIAGTEERFGEPVDQARWLEVVKSWTPAQRRDVEAYCGAVHLHASDNDDVEVPSRPAILDSLRPDRE